MGGRLPGHPLHLSRHINQLPGLGVGVVPGFQLRGNLQRPLQGDSQLHRHQLSDHIHRSVGHGHSPSHVPDSASGRHCAEGDDLGHVVCAVLPHHIVDDLLAALIAEVDVKVGHTDPLRVEKPLEQQVILDRVNTRNPDTVGGDASRPGASSRPYRNPYGFSVADKVVDNEIIVHIAHGFDGVQLIFQPLPDRGVGVRTVIFFKTLIALVPEILKMILSVRHLEMGQLGVAEFKFHIAHFRDFHRVVAGLGHLWEQRAHLLLCFEIKLVGTKFQVIVILQGMVGLDTQEDLMHLTVLFVNIVAVVGHYQGNPRLLGQGNQHGRDLLLFPDPMILKL